MVYAMGEGWELKVNGDETFETNCRSFLLQNTGPAAVYFENDIGEDASEGFRLAAGETLPFVVSARRLRLYSEQETTVRLLYVEEE